LAEARGVPERIVRRRAGFLKQSFGIGSFSTHSAAKDALSSGPFNLGVPDTFGTSTWFAAGLGILRVPKYGTVQNVEIGRLGASGVGNSEGGNIG